MRIAYAAVAVFSVINPFSQAQSKGPGGIPWTRERAVIVALQDNLSLRAARKSVEVANARLDASGLRPNPKIELSLGDDFAFNDEGESNTMIAFSQEFPLARRLQKEKAVSRVDIAKAKMEIRAHEFRIAQSISEIALEIQIVDTRLRLLNRLLDAAQSIADFIDSRVPSGEYSSLEASQALLETRSLRAEIKFLENERVHLSHSLAPFLNQDPKIEIEFAETQAIPVTEELLEFDSAIYERHPQFQLAILDAHAAEAEIALAQAKNWESVSAGIVYQNERSIDEPVGRESDRFFGVRFSIPLPLKKQGDLQAREHIIALDQSRIRMESLKRQIEYDIEHAHHEASDMQRQIAEYKTEVIDLAASNLDATRQAHELGQVGLVDLLKAQERMLQLEREYLDTIEVFARARLKLDVARLDTIPATTE